MCINFMEKLYTVRSGCARDWRPSVHAAIYRWCLSIFISTNILWIQGIHMFNSVWNVSANINATRCGADEGYLTNKSHVL